MASHSHIKSLDGIRGLAILLVLLFHSNIFGPGWIGVQIFFVLSGFLITSILLEEKYRTPADYFGRFYWRRSLRIFPLYFLFVAIVTSIYFVCGAPMALKADWPFLVTYAANLARLRQDDLGAPFVHLWSLAVEEQFYLIWPAIIFFCSNSALKIVLVAIISIVPALRLAFYFAFSTESPDWVGRNIYGLLQFDAFAIGAAIPVFNLQRIRYPRMIFVMILATSVMSGLVALLYEHTLHHDAVKFAFGYPMYLGQGYQFVWGYSLLDILAAAAIVAALKDSITSNLLQWRPLVRLGVISYGVYVIHLPVQVWLESLELPDWIQFALLVLLTTGLAELSFRFFESRFLRLKDKLRFGSEKALP